MNRHLSYKIVSYPIKFKKKNVLTGGFYTNQYKKHLGKNSVLCEKAF